MGKMSELEMIVKELRGYGENLIRIAEEMTEMFSASVQSEPEEASKKQLSLTEVRAVLAEKSRAGFTKEVKELLIKHGADKLSEINPAEYEALLAEVEVLGNGKTCIVISILSTPRAELSTFCKTQCHISGYIQ